MEAAGSWVVVVHGIIDDAGGPVGSGIAVVIKTLRM